MATPNTSDTEITACGRGWLDKLEPRHEPKSGATAVLWHLSSGGPFHSSSFVLRFLLP
jgi:hypothetical protein